MRKMEHNIRLKYVKLINTKFVKRRLVPTVYWYVTTMTSRVMTSDFGIEIIICQFPHMTVQYLSLCPVLRHYHSNKPTFPHSSGCGLFLFRMHGRQTLT
jgi:hypothetical protein